MTRCASSKHLQTRRFLDTLQSYLIDIQRILVQLHLSANQRPEPFVDHQGVLRDSKTGRPINGHRHGNSIDVASLDEDNMMSACSLFFWFRTWIGVDADVCLCRGQWGTRSSTAGTSRCSGGRRTGRRTTTPARSFLWRSIERRCCAEPWIEPGRICRLHNPGIVRRGILFDVYEDSWSAERERERK